MKILFVVLSLISSSLLMATERVELSLCDRDIRYRMSETEESVTIMSGVMCRNYCQQRQIHTPDGHVMDLTDCGYSKECQQEQQQLNRGKLLDRIKYLVVGEAYEYQGKIYTCNQP